MNFKLYGYMDTLLISPLPFRHPAPATQIASTEIWGGLKDNCHLVVPGPTKAFSKLR